MKTSARNVFRGQVAALREGAVHAEVDIALGSDTLVAVITMDAVRELGLSAGRDVVALVKAPWVMLMTDGADMRLSARNCLSGTVRAVHPGAVNSEVVVSLAGGQEVVSTVTREAVLELGLTPGAPVTAVIKASHVVVGVPATAP